MWPFWQEWKLHNFILCFLYSFTMTWPSCWSSSSRRSMTSVLQEKRRRKSFSVIWTTQSHVSRQPVHPQLQPISNLLVCIELTLNHCDLVKTLWCQGGWSTLVQVMAWYPSGAKSLPEKMLACFVNWTFGDKIQWNYQNTNIFIEKKNAFAKCHLQNGSHFADDIVKCIYF